VYWPKTWYRDADGDGLGDPNTKVNVCSSTPPAGFAANNRDTDDTPVSVPTVSPSLTKANNLPNEVGTTAATSLLLGSYPNPFQKVIRIQYTIGMEASVRLTIYDALGREVRNIFRGQRNAGTHWIDYNGSKLSSGVYYLRMVAVSGDKEYVQTQKLVKTD
jgi:hypothetical protein